MLANLKKLANSCVHTSNSRETTTHAKFATCFLCLYTLLTKRPTDLDNFEFLDELKSCTFIFTSVRHFVMCHAKHVNSARVLIGWLSPTHVLESFTRQIRVYQHEKVGEKVGENTGKFYLSPTVCQRVCRLFLCRSHAPTWVCQREFANLSLPCEGRLRDRSEENANRI